MTETGKHVISLSLKKPLIISDIIREKSLGLSESDLIQEFAYFLRKHNFQFGTKPYIIELDPVSGYILKAKSEIGRISTFNFEILLNPKFEGLSIGKCLGISQFSDKSLLKINTNEIVKESFSDKYEYSTIEYLVYGLIDSVFSINRNGIARTFKEVFGNSTKLGGSISIQKSIEQGSLINPIVSDIVPDLNISPNKLIKFALERCVERVSNNALEQLVNIALELFKDVSGEIDQNILKSSFFYRFNLPRPEYEKAIIFSQAIIRGWAFGEGEDSISFDHFRF